ncbi:UDP-glucosyltransferase 2 [Amyelois transitella]|uniref:UDP-glucosyltransferase 2 n=1 Tax=Amyelois transitella TaxID=680683 RepID=UPI00298FF1B4|nr:UDP-glucosyltransferase 2 [Amyelois transitella]
MPPHRSHLPVFIRSGQLAATITRSIKMKFTFFILFGIITTSQALNILGIFPYQGKSHFIVFKVYLQELANRGHNVTVISHFPEKDAPNNYKDISLAKSASPIEDSVPVERSYLTILGMLYYLTDTGIENCEAMLANQEVQRLIKEKTKFDVVVLEQFNSDCALGIAYKLGAPVVGTVAHILMPWHYQRLGIPYNPAYVPFHFLEGGTKPSLYQRVERTLFDIGFRSLYYLRTQRSNEITLAKYFDDIPPLETLAREIKFLLVSHNFMLTGSRLFPANVIEVGGYHVSKAKQLPADLEKFIQSSEHGVIYISFGSVVKSSSMSETQIQAILGAMAKLPQKFIWKWESDTLVADKNKLYVAKWLPQVDILAHRKTLAFMSHAGMGGTTEAIHYGVPMVAMPIMGDQPANAASIEESGLGVQLQVTELTKENLLAAFKKVLDPEFRENVNRLSKAWHERPLSPLDTAVFWTEFAAKHSKFTFRTAAADVPFYQYINLDVYTILTLIAMLPVIAVWILCCRTKKVVDAKNIKKN